MAERFTAAIALGANVGERKKDCEFKKGFLL